MSTTVLIGMTGRDVDRFEWQKPNRRGQPEYYFTAVSERNSAEKKYFHLCDVATPEECAEQLKKLEELDRKVEEAYDRWQEELFQKFENQKGAK